MMQFLSQWLICWYFFCISTCLTLYGQKAIHKLPNSPLNTFHARQSFDRYILTAWEIEQGLPQNSIHAATQTSDGYLWLATAEGLVRFDGVRFHIFDKNTSALPDNNITGLFAAPDGALWTLTQTGGIYLYRHGKFNRLKAWDSVITAIGVIPKIPRNPSTIAMDSVGRIWVATTSGLLSFANDQLRSVYSETKNIHSHTTKKYYLTGQPQTLLCSQNGLLWVGTMQGLAYIDAAGAVHHVALQNSFNKNAHQIVNIQALAEDHQHRIWVGTSNGLYCLTEKFGTWQSEPFSQTLPSNNISALLVDTDNTLWIGMIGMGIHSYREGVLLPYFSESSLQRQSVIELFQDAEGGIVIGTSRNGLYRLHIGQAQPFARSAGVSDAMGVFEDNVGTMWFLTARKGIGLISIYPNGTVRTWSTENGLPSNEVNCIMQDRDSSLWVGFRDKGICRLKNGKVVESYTSKDGISHPFCFMTYRDTSHRLWIATLSGLCCLENGSIKKYGPREGLPVCRITVLMPSKHHRWMWVATEKGLYALSDGKVLRSWTHQNGLSNEDVISLFEDTDGTLWAGTIGGGLLCITDKTVYSITTRQGLFDDMMYAILPDQYGNLWMSCNKGVFRAKISDLYSCMKDSTTKIECIHYGKSEGMPSAECNGGSSPSAIVGHDGRLWFPTLRGACFFIPTNTFSALPILYESFMVNGQEIDYSNQETLLSASAERIEFHYTSPQFNNPTRLRFRYILEGYDAGWIDAGIRRTTLYTNLPRGRMYRFRVQTAGLGGTWNDAQTFIRFSIQHYWWETWWFYGVCAVIACIVGYGMIQFRLQRLAAQNRRLQGIIQEHTEEIRNQAEEIQQMNRRLQATNQTLEVQNSELVAISKEKDELLGIVAHDLRNPLSVIMSSVELIERYFLDETNQEARHFTTLMANTGERMLAILQDLLNIHQLEYGTMAMNIAAVDLQMVEHIVNAHQFAARQKDIYLHFVPDKGISGNDTSSALMVLADERMLHQIIENLISNAIKFSPNQKDIWVRVYGHHSEKRNSVARIEVQDEGPGLSDEDKTKLFGKFARLSAQPTGGEHSIGLGLSIVKKMVEAMNGRVWCESELGKGATFIMELPSVEEHDGVEEHIE